MSISALIIAKNEEQNLTDCIRCLNFVDQIVVIVDDSKRVSKALGSNRIIRTESDERVREFRRSIVASRKILAGEVFTEDMIDYKRPGGGLDPEFSKFIIGRKAKNQLKFDEMIKIEDLQ